MLPALWCPSMRVPGAGPGQHHHRRLRQRRAATIIRRLSLLGAHALAISRDHRAATTAGTRTAAPTAAHTGLRWATPIDVDHRSPLPTLAAIAATVARRRSVLRQAVPAPSERRGDPPDGPRCAIRNQRLAGAGAGRGGAAPPRWPVARARRRGPWRPAIAG